MKKAFMLVLILLAAVLCLSGPALAANSDGIIISGIESGNAYTSASAFNVNLQADQGIRQAVVTLSRSCEYAKDEVWYKTVYPKGSEFEGVFNLGGKTLSKSKGSIVQSFLVQSDGCRYLTKTQQLEPGEYYYLHVTLYRNGQRSVSEIVGPFEVK
jgi:hypothetical protein